LAGTPGSAYWVYASGVMNWPGDYSWNATVNYSDTTGESQSGPADIAVTVTSGTGGWQPYAWRENFNTAPYRYFVVALKPTLAGQTWAVGFHGANHKADGITIENITQYGPPGGPVVGQWGTYKIPLSAFALDNTTVLDFFIQDQLGTGVFYVDSVGFTAATTSWVYINGLMLWPGDRSLDAIIDYEDAAGGPLSGTSDIAVTSSAGSGGWQPYAPNVAYDTSAYAGVVISLKPTVPDQVWAVGFHGMNDLPDGKTIMNIAQFGPPGGPVVGQWGSYTIPLSSFALTDASIVDFFVRDQLGAGEFYVDNVGFSSSVPRDTTAWVYHNGALNWAGDWSSNATPNYHDVSGQPLIGEYDIAVTVVPGTTGLWQPYYDGFCQTDTSLCFVTTPYKHLIFMLKPVVANAVWASHFFSSGDTLDGVYIPDISAYCSGGSNPPVNEWEACSIPLSAFALTNPKIVKFFIQDQSGQPLFYVDEVGFTVD